LRGDLIVVYKILNDKERVDKAKSALDSHGLRGHSEKLFKPRCATTVRRTFFSSRVVNDWINLPQPIIDTSLVNTFKNYLDKFWKDMGVYS